MDRGFSTLGKDAGNDVNRNVGVVGGEDELDLSSSGSGAGTALVLGREKRTDPAVAGGAGVHPGLVPKERGGRVGVRTVGAAPFVLRSLLV